MTIIRRISFEASIMIRLVVLLDLVSGVVLSLLGGVLCRLCASCTIGVVGVVPNSSSILIQYM
jgi:hypothetical protein